MCSLKIDNYRSHAGYIRGFIRPLLTKIFMFALSGCHHQPINLEQTANENYWDLSYQKGRNYPMVLVSSRTRTKTSNLHIYIEGDGLPWKSTNQVSTNPTSRNPVALRLMKYDDGHALYLGRPCYFGLHNDFRCNPSVWTDARYSKNVVDEMNLAINAYLDQKGLNHAAIIGFSGGGTLGLLLANRNPRITGVLMIAANFDTTEWARLHHYSELYASLNPAKEIKQREFKEVFWFGEEDLNVPIIPFAAMAEKHVNSRVSRFEHVDHVCCWEELARKGEIQRALHWIDGDHP